MRPTREQIEVAAYDRWQRRGGEHGRDRDDWVAAEKDLIFSLNYRYVARHKLSDPGGVPLFLGKAEAEASRGGKRRCRFCELSEPSASFDSGPPAVPEFLGDTTLVAWDECDDCHAQYEEALAGPFEDFARPLIVGPDGSPESIPAPGLKAMVRIALSVMPVAELHHFGDTVEWVANPDHARDAATLGTIGCHVYRTPGPVSSPFVALARRVDDDAPFPYMIFFLAASQVVFQTHLPLCPRDEELDDDSLRGPELSMSMGSGSGFRPSACVFLPVEAAGREGLAGEPRSNGSAAVRRGARG